MINAFRQKGLTSAVYGLIIVATVVVFIVQFRPGAQGRSGSLHQECAAEVRGRCIEPKEFQAELMLVAPGRLIEPSQLNKLGLRKIVLDGLVERSLLERDAERLGLTVSDDDLDSELIAGRVRVSLPVQRARAYSYPLRLNDGVRNLNFNNPDTKAFDYKIYDRLVRQFSNRSPTEFKVMQRSELVAARLRDLIKQRVRVSDAEAYDAYVQEKSTATIRFAKLRPSWFAAHAMDLSPRAVDAWAKAHDEEVKRVFESSKSQYLPECRRTRHILVKVAEGATDEEKASARAKIDGLAKRLKHEDFADVAREASDDLGSAVQGGDLGCVTRGKMVKPFEDATFALGAGQTSDVVTTQFGLHLIKVESIFKDDAAAAEGLREVTRNLMIKEEGETLAAETGKKVLAAAKAGKKLDDALNEALAAVERAKPEKGAAGKSAASTDDDRPKVEISGAFSAGGDPIPGAGPATHVGQMAFKLEHDGDVADDLVKLDDGYAIFQLKDKTVASRDQFEKDRDTFLPAMIATKQADALNGYVARLRDAAKSEIKLNDAYAKADEKEKRPGEGDEE